MDADPNWHWHGHSRVLLDMVVPDLHELLLALVDIREVVDHLARLQLQPVRVRPRTDEKIKYKKTSVPVPLPPPFFDGFESPHFGGSGSCSDYCHNKIIGTAKNVISGIPK